MFIGIKAPFPALHITYCGMKRCAFRSTNLSAR